MDSNTDGTNIRERNVYRCIVQGNINQGDAVFLPFSRGRQCVLNCYAFLLKCKCKGISWDCTSRSLDCLLYAGDMIYQYIKRQKPEIEYCLITDIPKYIQFPDQTSLFSYVIQCSFSGFICENGAYGYPCITLESSIYSAFLPSLKAFSILIMQGNAIGIYYDGNVFYLFDPHARNTSGVTSSGGSCVFGSVVSHQDLLQFLLKLLLVNMTNRYMKSLNQLRKITQMSESKTLKLQHPGV